MPAKPNTPLRASDEALGEEDPQQEALLRTADDPIAPLRSTKRRRTSRTRDRSRERCQRKVSRFTNAFLVHKDAKSDAGELSAESVGRVHDVADSIQTPRSGTFT